MGNQGVFEEKKEEYWKADKKRKGEILKSVSEVTGLTRKACIKRFRKLQKTSARDQEQRGRPVYYTPDVTAALREVWEISSESCGENLHPLINEYIDIRTREDDWRHADDATRKLRAMSLASVKRALGGFVRTRRSFGEIGRAHV